MAASTPKGFRLHIGIFGRRNVGKSSLLNAITRQNVSIVSDHAGTTTDPVEKPMELLPIGPVLFIDTAGIDDEGAVGELRIAKTQQAFDRTDLGIIVTEPGGWGPFEDSILHELQLRKIPLIVAINKIDTTNANAIENGNYLSQLASAKIPVVRMSALHGQGIAELRQALLDQTPAEFLDNPTIVGDLVGQGELAILVVPIDKEAPKGRLILPQVQTIRDLLDHNAATLVLKEDALRPMLQQLSQPPK
ncbi:MAG: GTP-binding protein, partial [Phycisphaerae bacterium]|nr:GTP-binding protein [Phycisphaerae bacterium]